MRRQGLIEDWYDRNIVPGSEWDQEISDHLDSAQIILPLISPDFMDSDYCYDIEMKRPWNCSTEVKQESSRSY
jgi:hypothetical protein